ncbi:dihydrolipoamide acetyltransferase family protein [Luethyella okanaganae]|uniref:Dihydrolipoamide acetyltransferase component of pyruvate dehydrogenase complex n=1 Tax=Luethyella okanaganae TaxID=69372 RepID=A0ABW1VEM1_9MICO
MSREFLLPDLGEGLTEAEIVTWLVQPGDAVAIDQPVVEVESAKSVVELPSPFGGVVEKLHGAPGTVVHAGQPIITVADAVEAAEPRSIEHEISGAVLIGYGTQQSTRARRAPSTGRFARSTVGETTMRSGRAAADHRHTVLDPGRHSPVISPIVRRLARENGFDASQLLGSGHDALVLRSDVEDYLGARLGEETPPAPSTSEPPTAEPGEMRIPIRGLRRVTGERLAASRREIPEATVWMDVDATGLVEAKTQLEQATGEPFGLTALLARFVVAGLKRYPVLNATFDIERHEIVQHGSINLGLAAQTPRGLMVPVVHDAERMSTRQLRDAVADLVAHTADGSFAPSALTGGTFTLNNFGALGVDGSAAIINHPEVAILGIGRMIDRAWVVDGALAVRKVLELSFVFDHRVCDGGVAAGFLTYVAGCVERPIGLLGDL